MAWRLLVAIVVGYLVYGLYRKVRQAFRQGLSGSGATRPQGPEALVQDPSCGTFIPRQEALKYHKDGQDFFFCSEGCLKRFQRGGPE